MRRILVAGNWKMNGSLADARTLVSEICRGVEDDATRNDGTGNDGGGIPEMLVCPPAYLLFPMAKAIAGSPVKLGAQNLHEADSGAFTGEMSAPMIAETGAAYVIAGHSERRRLFGETNARLAQKVPAGMKAGLTVIYCVGETLEEREAGQTESVVVTQMREGLKEDISAERLVIAYEPVWAIGTGKTATPEQAQEVHGLIRRELGERFGGSAADEVRILYGGSVKPNNAGSLLAQPDIDGALVGGASLAAADFLAIMRNAIAPR